MTHELRLGVNIDHVATLRNARGGAHPEPLRAARLVAEAGADGITAHLREDRRHITDADMRALAAEGPLPLNMEMAATDEMLAIARELAPHAVCLVPEHRAERTTEGGLDAAGGRAHLGRFVEALGAAGARVALFVEPEAHQLEAAKALGAAAVELHTGAYANAAAGGAAGDELARLQRAAAEAERLGLECHAGHGLDADNVGPVAAIPEVVELNIGHYLVGEAVFVGLAEAVRRMRVAMGEARAVLAGPGTA